jgi:hypothetical protein
MTGTVTIFMPLVGEAVEVWRPVSAIPSGRFFQVMGPEPDDEDWAFKPEALVRCAPKVFADGTSGLTVVAAAGNHDGESSSG